MLQSREDSLTGVSSRVTSTIPASDVVVPAILKMISRGVSRLHSLMSQ